MISTIFITQPFFLHCKKFSSTDSQSLNGFPQTGLTPAAALNFPSRTGYFFVEKQLASNRIFVKASNLMVGIVDDEASKLPIREPSQA